MKRFMQLALVATLSAGCGEGPTEPARAGEFVAVVSGAHSFTIRVLAQNRFQGSRWAIVGTTEEVAIFLNFDARPTTGEHLLIQHQIPRGSVSVPPNASEQTFNSISGSIVITESTPDRVSGHFDFTADPVFEPNDGQRVHVQGSFDTVCQIACDSSGPGLDE